MEKSKMDHQSVAAPQHMNNLATMIMHLLRSHYRIYAVLTVTSFLLAFSLLYCLPTPHWQISGLIRIGQTASLDGDSKIEMALVMSRDVSMALIRQGTSGIASNDTAVVDDWDLRVRPTAVDLLEVKVRAPSIEEANKIYATLIGRLKIIHDEIYTARINFWTQQSDRISAEIAEGQKALQIQANHCAAQSTKEFENALDCTNRLANEAARLDLLKRFQSKIQETLLPNWSYPTNTLGSLNHSSRPVSPTGPTALVLSLFLALAFVTSLLIIGSICTSLTRSDRQTE